MVWAAMIQRCTNRKNKKYPSYGGRGITVCTRWRESSTAFLTDMGPRPTPEHSLERRDNDGHYEPENCKWATVEDQMSNQRSNRRLTFNDRTLTAAQWARELNCSPMKIYNRLWAGWSDERILAELIHKVFM